MWLFFFFFLRRPLWSRHAHGRTSTSSPQCQARIGRRDRRRLRVDRARSDPHAGAHGHGRHFGAGALSFFLFWRGGWCMCVRPSVGVRVLHAGSLAVSCLRLFLFLSRSRKRSTCRWTCTTTTTTTMLSLPLPAVPTMQTLLDCGACR